MKQGHLIAAFLALLLWWLWPIRLYRRKPRGDPLDETITTLAHIPISGRTLASGVIWCGGVGSGKTSCSGHMLVDMLRAGYSAVCFTVQIGEVKHLESLIILAGVPNLPVIRIGRDHLENKLNVVALTYQATGGSIEAVAQLFEALMAAVQSKKVSSEDATSRFFSQMGLTAVKHATIILAAVDPSKLSFTRISEFITRAPNFRYILYPKSQEERAHVEAFKQSLWWKIKRRAEWSLAKGQVAPERARDVGQAIEFFLTEFAEMPDKSRASVISTITTMTSVFGFYPLQDMLATATTIDPKMLEEGQCVWLLTDPAHQGIDRKLVQLAIKYIVQAQAQRRDTSKSKQRVVLWIDEFPQLVLSAQRLDSLFQAQARQKLYCQVLAVQNYAQLKEAFGSEDEANDFLSNIRTKIAMAVDEPWTQKILSELIGKEMKFLPSPEHHHPTETGIDWFGANRSPAQYHSQMDHTIYPHEWGSLQKAKPGQLGEAIVYLGGSKFADGKTYARVWLKQLLD